MTKKVNVGEMTVKELKTALKAKGLPSTGNKRVLVERLQLAMAPDDNGPNNENDHLDDAGALLGDDNERIEETAPRAAAMANVTPVMTERDIADLIAQNVAEIKVSMEANLKESIAANKEIMEANLARGIKDGVAKRLEVIDVRMEADLKEGIKAGVAKELKDLEDRNALQARHTAHVASISVKLPSFWPDQPQVWFVLAEAEFELAGIVDERVKFSHVARILDSNTTVQVLDILQDGSKSYSGLKNRLLETYELQPRERAARVIDANGLGDMTPTQWLNKMLPVVPSGEEPGFLFRELFLRQMPQRIQILLASFLTNTGYKTEDLRRLAKEADKFVLEERSRGQGANAVSISGSEGDTTVTHDLYAVAKSPFCFFHYVYGPKAIKCRKKTDNGSPCAWKNGPDGSERTWRAPPRNPNRKPQHRKSTTPTRIPTGNASGQNA